MTIFIISICLIVALLAGASRHAAEAPFSPVVSAAGGLIKCVGHKQAAQFMVET
jgi:hypothetical protein